MFRSEPNLLTYSNHHNFCLTITYHSAFQHTISVATTTDLEGKYQLGPRDKPFYEFFDGTRSLRDSCTVI